MVTGTLYTSLSATEEIKYFLRILGSLMTKCWFSATKLHFDGIILLCIGMIFIDCPDYLKWICYKSEGIQTLLSAGFNRLRTIVAQDDCELLWPPLYTGDTAREMWIFKARRKFIRNKQGCGKHRPQESGCTAFIRRIMQRNIALHIALEPETLCSFVRSEGKR